jgi:hypothetical protein
VLSGNREAMATVSMRDLEEILAATLTGMPVDEFNAEVTKWIGTAKHPRWDRLYTDLTYKPMLELLGYLRTNGYGKDGKPEGIHLMIGRRPVAAFGNSTGDQQMLEYTKAGEGARLSMLVLHDDAEREYAYGPAQGLPDSKVGTFTQALYDEAQKPGWTVISIKKDWKRIFSFE